MKKPRGDSKLKTMPPEQQAQVVAWLQAPGGTREAVRDRIEKEFGIQTNPASLSDFFVWYTENRALTEQLDKAAAMAEDLQAWMRTQSGKVFDDETINGAAQMMFEMQAAKGGDSKTFMELKQLRQNDRRLQHDATKVKLAGEALKLERQKFEFNAAKSAMALVEEIRAIKSDRGMNEDRKLQAVRERLFGVVPDEDGSRGAEARSENGGKA